jgi:hypothetical protein
VTLERSQDLASLRSAIEWTRARWDENRIAPLRLHESGTDGALGGLRYAKLFTAILMAHPDSRIDEERSVPCAHTLRRGTELCPTCSVRDEHGRPMTETGVMQTTTERYRYPMWRALARLRNALPYSRLGLHPYQLVVGLAAHGWDPRATARSFDLPWDLAEAAMLRSIRQLASRYEEGPVARRVPFTELSESQQRAEAVA